VLFLGPPGVGKTRLSIALGLKACEKRKRVLFTYANELIEQLMAAKVNGLLPLMALAIEQRKKWELRVITKGVKIKWERGAIFNGN